jgi:SAM-dependent methyltransferase
MVKEKFEDIFFKLDLSFDAKILEIGAGNNPMKEWFANKGYNNYTSIDNESEYTTNEIIADAHNLPFIHSSFDLVFMSHVAEHFLNPLLALKEIYRVLKPDGIVISFTPFPCEHQILQGDANHIFVLTPIQWMRLYNTAGFLANGIKFEIVTIFEGKQIWKEQDYNVVMICQKLENRNI